MVGADRSSVQLRPANILFLCLYTSCYIFPRFSSRLPMTVVNYITLSKHNSANFCKIYFCFVNLLGYVACWCLGEGVHRSIGDPQELLEQYTVKWVFNICSCLAFSVQLNLSYLSVCLLAHISPNSDSNQRQREWECVPWPLVLKIAFTLFSASFQTFVSAYYLLLHWLSKHRPLCSERDKKCFWHNLLFSENFLRKNSFASFHFLHLKWGNDGIKHFEKMKNILNWELIIAAVLYQKPKCCTKIVQNKFIVGK